MIAALTGQGINVQQACRTLEVSESGYYAWRGRPDPPRTLRRIWLAGEIADIHKQSGGTYGALRVTAELRYGRHIVAGHNAVEDIMHQLGLKGLPTRRLPRGAKLRAVTSLDLVHREFKRRGPNELWFTDITEHPTREGKVFCCVVLDTFSRKVVGWAIDPGPDDEARAERFGDGNPAPSFSRWPRDAQRPRGQLGLNRSSQQCASVGTVTRLSSRRRERSERRSGDSRVCAV